MKFTITDRAEGKTTKAAEMLLADESLVLVCANGHAADHARRIFQRMDGVPERFRLGKDVKQYLESRVVIFEDLDRLRGRRGVKLIFDDADSILQRLAFAFEVVHVFASGEAVPLTTTRSK